MTETALRQTLGVVLDAVHDGAEAPFARYLHEILRHAGLSYQDGLTPATRVLIVAGGTAPEQTPSWVSQGGHLVILGDPGPLSVLAGVAVTGTVIEDRLVLSPAPPWESPPDVPLRAFGGVRLAPVDSTVSVLGRWAGAHAIRPGRDGGHGPAGSGAPGDEQAPATSGPAALGAGVTLRRHGSGQVMVIGADLCQSVVRIQQGWPVHTDATPPGDGTSPVDDGLLKVDDGIALSYRDDRALPRGQELCPGFRHAWPPDMVAPYFHRPHADLWRHLLIRTLWWLAPPHSLPWLGYWPAGVPAIGHLSHDTDGNSDADAAVALDLFAQAKVPSTWCLLPTEAGGPELSAATLHRIRAERHELGLHFDALTSGRGFTETELAAQLAWARQRSPEPVITNKNHYLRWEGDDEFYRWCDTLGIRIDGTRGPGTQGNAGFPFGTSHPALPLGRKVLMLPLHFQDLAWTIQPEVAQEVLAQVLAHHGVLHCLFHGANLRLSADTRAAALSIVDMARALGMQWWTAAQIGEWEHARRAVTISTEPGMIHIDSTVPLRDAAILIPLGGGTPPHITGAACRQYVVVRHGLAHLEVAVDLLPGRTTLRLC